MVEGEVQDVRLQAGVLWAVVDLDEVLVVEEAVMVDVEVEEAVMVAEVDVVDVVEDVVA